jgi:hypothetical protein
VSLREADRSRQRGPNLDRIGIGDGHGPPDRPSFRVRLAPRRGRPFGSPRPLTTPS